MPRPPNATHVRAKLLGDEIDGPSLGTAHVKDQQVLPLPGILDRTRRGRREVDEGIFGKRKNFQVPMGHERMHTISTIIRVTGLSSHTCKTSRNKHVPARNLDMFPLLVRSYLINTSATLHTLNVYIYIYAYLEGPNYNLNSV